MSAIPFPRARAARLIPTVAVALTLATATGIAVAQGSGGTGSGGMGTAGMGNGPGSGLTPTLLPSATASGTAPGPAGAPQASQPAPAPPPSGATRPPAAGTPSPTVPAKAVPTRARPTTTATTTSPPALIVRYHVVSQWDQGFEGEVAVVNNGSSPISDWQIVVALPGDQFTAVSRNASGYASNHILLLHPAADANQVPANGTLRVFFTTYGAELTPRLCAFNDTQCSSGG